MANESPTPTIEALQNQIKMHKKEVAIEMRRGWRMNIEFIADHLNWIKDKSGQIKTRMDAEKEPS